MGEKYDRVSPVIEGYKANKPRVSGEMPPHDLTVVVIYTPTDITIDEYDTPLGFGVGLNLGECIE